MLHRIYFALLSIIALMGLAPAALAQTYPYNVETRPVRGIMPTSDQSGGSFESIDPVSGKLHLEIPIVSLPPGHGGSGFDLNLVYDSHLYDIFPAEGYPYIYEFLKVSPTSGWQFNFDYVLTQELRALPSWQNACELDNSNIQYRLEHERIYRTRISLPDGSQHILHLRGYGDELGDGYWGDGFYGIGYTGRRSPCATRNPIYPGSNISNGELTYYTTDGSYLKLVVHADAGAALSTNNTWTLFMPDGRLVKGAGAAAVELDDANGNAIRIASTCIGACNYLRTILSDDFNRQIQIDKVMTSDAYQIVITAAGPQGPAQWTLDWTRNSPASQAHTYICLDHYASDSSTDVSCSIGNQQYWMLRTMQLPGAAATYPPPEWNSFEFGYSNETIGGWGEVNYIRTPAGAQYRYNYLQDGRSATAAEIAGFNAVTRKTLTHDGEQQIWTYTTSKIRSIVTAPDGGITTYSFYNVSDVHLWYHGLVYRIDEPEGKIRRRLWWQNPAWGQSGGSATRNPNNPFIFRETVSVANAAGQPVRTAVTDTMIDKNGNSRERREYDWVGFNPNSIEEGVAQIRSTVHIYYVDVPAAPIVTNDSGAYWSDHLAPACGAALLRLNAARRAETHDGTGGTVGITEFDYDCPYTSGNLTAEKRWDNMRSPSAPPLGALSTANAVVFSKAYDAYGNLTDIFEPAVSTHIVYGSILGSGGPGPYPTLVEYARGTPVARSWSYVWNPNTGTLTSKTDVQNNTFTAYTYDVYGRRLTVDEAGVRLSQTEYLDDKRKLISKHDLTVHGDGKLQRVVQYDQLSRIVLVRDSDGANLNVDDSSDGIKMATAYFTSTGGSWVVTSSPYRNADDATLAWTCTKKDKLGRLIAVAVFKGGAAPQSCEPSPTLTGISRNVYDADRTIITDPAGKVRAEDSDAAGRVVRVIEDPGALDYATRYLYDAFDHLRGVIQSDGFVTQSRTFEFNSLGQLMSSLNPESGRVSFSYTAAGDIASRTDARGIVTYFAYDALHRLEAKSYAGDGGMTPAVAYTYYREGDTSPNIGRLKSTTSAAASSSSEFNVLGLPVSNTQIVNGVPFTFYYSYSLNNGITAMRYPSGKTLNFSIDAAGRVNKLSAGTRVYADMTYSDLPFTADGRIAEMKLGNDLWESRRYASPGQPTVLRLGTARGGNDKLEIEFDYSASEDNGNLVGQVIRQGAQTWRQNYTYDAVSRLATASEVGGFSRTYDYDRFGNRWVIGSSGIQAAEVHEPTAGTLFDRSTNRLALQGYDASGNQTTFSPRALVYDGENRLIRAESPGNGNEYFRYDGDGRRVQKFWTPSGGATQEITYVYGPNGHVAAEYSDQVESNSGTSWMFADIFGSVRAVTGEKPPNGTAAITECYDYLPFGRMLSASENGRNTGCYPAAPDYVLSTVEAPKFTGKERDVEIGLDYFGARYMSPAEGRFVSPDPVTVMTQKILDPQQWNMYAYVRNNPLRLVDGNGKWPTEIHNAMIADAFPGLDKGRVGVMQNASVRVDGVLNGGQLSINAYKHGMRAPNQTREEARSLADGFIASQESKASYLAKLNGKVTDTALDQFGEALHTVMDRTSPSHKGEQLWLGVGEHFHTYDPSISMGEIAIEAEIAKIHTLRESTIPLSEYHLTIDLLRAEYLNTFGQAEFFKATGCRQVEGCAYPEQSLPYKFQRRN